MGATLVVKGIEELTEKISKMAQNAQTDAVVQQMLFAGAEEMKKAWQEAIVKKDLIDTWAMHDSIGFKPETESYGGAEAITVTPQGKDASGTSNSEKAWVLEHGVPSKNIMAHHHIEEAKRIAESTVEPAMRKIFNAYVETGTIPTVQLSENNPGGKPTKAHKKDRRGRRNSKRRRND